MMHILWEQFRRMKIGETGSVAKSPNGLDAGPPALPAPLTSLDQSLLRYI